jgi:hypothetical protein
MPRALSLLISILLASVPAFAQSTPPPSDNPHPDSQQTTSPGTPNSPQTSTSAVPPQPTTQPQTLPPQPAEDRQTPTPASQQTDASSPGDTQQASNPQDKEQKSDASEQSEDKEKSAGKSNPDKQDDDAPVRTGQIHNPVLWHDPGEISSLDLFNGEGGKDGMPTAPLTFESEDHNGTNPKFDVRDGNGKKWRVKLGPEARPEVVASRLLWAVGYFVNDDYVLESVDVTNLHISRGEKLAKDGHIEMARFARKPGGQKKIGIWEWKQNPFTGKREFNGLRVMMAVMNNWDLKDINNAVYEDKKSGREIFLTSDVGATFGTNGLVLPISHSKGDLDSYKKSKFITRVTDTEVDFSTPKKPTGFLLETVGAGAKQYAMRSGLDWIGNNIPREDARWMGSLLSQLSHQQLVDAFRAGRFPEDQIDVYVEIVENRIQELKTL